MRVSARPFSCHAIDIALKHQNASLRVCQVQTAGSSVSNSETAQAKRISNAVNSVRTDVLDAVVAIEMHKR